MLEALLVFCRAKRSHLLGQLIAHANKRTRPIIRCLALKFEIGQVAARRNVARVRFDSLREQHASS